MKKKLWFFLLIAGIIFICILFFLLKKKSVPSLVPLTQQAKGKFIMEPENFYATGSGEFVNIKVVADSNDMAVVGFDIDFTYDKDNLQFINAVSADPENFDFFKKEKDDEVLITAIKKINLSKEIFFKKTVLAVITFKTIGNNNSEVKFIYEKNSKRESNLISEKNEDILSEVRNCTINFGQNLDLKLNTPIPFDDLTIELITVDMAKETCLDCLETAIISVKKK